ncbi:MAG: BatA and WFA domain-containing protein [Chrysiogenetes bacterium]|nr:BatA and WFA domain-containing protein [Chrysiogenetes bacterium]
MQWLHPLLLGLGGLAVAVPVLLHLIHRKRGAQVPFAAVRFLADTELPTARHLRLRDALLLLLRVLAVLLIALWLSRPFRELPATASQLGDGPASLVIIFDNSFSMLYEESSGPRTEAAKSAARALIESLKEGDRAALLTMVPSSEQVDHLSTNREELLQALSNIETSYAHADGTGALRRAIDVLHGDVAEDKRIYVFTDAQRGSWSPAEAPPEDDRIPVVLVDVRSEKESSNHAILQAALTESGSAQSLAQSVEIEVGAWGRMGQGELPLALYDGDDLLTQGIVSTQSAGVLTKTLSYDSTKELSPRGVLRLEPDALAVDDTYSLVLRSNPSVEVLLVDGDPRPVKFFSETYFLENALSPTRNAASRVRATTIRAEAFRDADLTKTRVVVLANVSASDLGPAGWDKLMRFVEEGGGLFIGLGDQVDPDEYNRVAESLLPARLRLALDVSSRSFSQQGGELHAGRLAQVDFQHPALRIFGKGEQVDFGKANFEVYVLTEAADESKSAALMRFGNGAPALLEGRHGRGKVLLWTSALDLQWSDFAIKPTYLPLIHQLVYYLANTLRDAAARPFVVGERVSLRPPTGARRALVSGPGNLRQDLEVPADAPGLPIVFEDTQMPGIYEVSWQSEAETDEADSKFWFAVNLPREESDLSALDAGELSKLVNLEVHGVESEDGEVGSARGLFARSRREEYWRSAAMTLLALLLAEGLLTGVIAGRRRRA